MKIKYIYLNIFHRNVETSIQFNCRLHARRSQTRKKEIFDIVTSIEEKQEKISSFMKSLHALEKEKKAYIQKRRTDG